MVITKVMEYVIRLIKLASGASDPNEGKYVKDFDPAAFDGRGSLVSTPDEDLARRFPNAIDAWEYWRQSAGRRPDGKHNRPLTAWTVDIKPLDEAIT